MKKAMTRASIIAASALSFALVGMGGAASASSINVSTQGPNSGVYISSGSGSWGGNTWGDNNWGNDWNDNQGTSQCNGNQNGWTAKKQNNCCKKSVKQTCIKAWRSCWNWCRSSNW
jgi:hypothetical protein